MDQTTALKQAQVNFYNCKYRNGGWKYNYEKEYRDLNRITQAICLPPKSQILEIGCGMGFHTKILHDLGFDATGNDLSKEGISFATENHSGPTYVCQDTIDFISKTPPESFDAILCRGHSWYHYELNEKTQKGLNIPELTKQIFTILKKDGAFILCIRTDFSGKIYEDGVHNNTYENYLRLFNLFGTIVYLSDQKGNLLFTEKSAILSGDHIVIVTRKGESKTFVKFDNVTNFELPNSRGRKELPNSKDRKPSVNEFFKSLLSKKEKII